MGTLVDQKKRILVASPIDKDAIRYLHEQHDVECCFGASYEELRALIEDREILIFRSGVTISEELMSRAPALRLLIRAGSGYDNIDLEYVAQQALLFERIPQPGARAVAELTFAFMLALARNLPKADRSFREGKWSKYEMEGYLLRGKTLGIIGVGNIGAKVGEMGLAWGMRVMGCVEERTEPIEAALAQKGITLVDFAEVISEADFLCVHVPLTSSTRNLINADVLAKVKKGAYLMDLSRGGVTNEAELFDALTRGRRLRGAALDVHSAEDKGERSPLADLPNVILTPHIGAQTIDSQREIGQRVLEIVASYCENGGRHT